MKRIIEISIADILLDPAAASLLLTRACRRGKRGNLTVRGCCPVSPALLFLLDDETKIDLLPEYHLAPMKETSTDGILAEINARYAAGQTFIGSFTAADKNWALYESRSRAEDSPPKKTSSRKKA